MIRGITISNFLALRGAEYTFTEHGALIEGGNGRGKSTVLKAIKAALDGVGVSPEAVRKGETSAEILIDLDHDSVRRRITSTGRTTVEVLTTEGATRKSPAAFIGELLGLALLDPLDLFLAKPKDRRAIILRAVPCRATPELVAPVLADVLQEEKLETILGPDAFAGHGLDVLDQLRRWAEEKRLAAGRLVKDREKEETAAVKLAKELELAEMRLRGAPSKGAAGEFFARATQAKSSLEARAATAEHAASYIAGRRQRAAELEAEAARIVRAAPLVTTLDERRAQQELEAARQQELEALNAFDAAAKEVRRIEAMLREAGDKAEALAETLTARRGVTREAEREVEDLAERSKRWEADDNRARELVELADRELAAVKELAAEPPSTEETAAVAEALAEAMRAVQLADAAERARADLEAALAAVDTKTREARQLGTQHAALDKAVKALRDDLPLALTAGAGSLFRGLTITGDTVLVDDGTGAHVDVELLSTAAQMRFALGVAKALNAKSKLLLVDGLERIEPERRREFVALAIEGGYQLFATRVTEGPLTVTPIEGGAS